MYEDKTDAKGPYESELVRQGQNLSQPSSAASVTEMQLACQQELHSSRGRATDCRQGAALPAGPLSASALPAGLQQARRVRADEHSYRDVRV